MRRATAHLSSVGDNKFLINHILFVFWNGADSLFCLTRDPTKLLFSFTLMRAFFAQVHVYLRLDDGISYPTFAS
jgi:hypothetical protein